MTAAEKKAARAAAAVRAHPSLMACSRPARRCTLRGDAPVSALCSLSKVSPVVVYGEDLVGPSAIKTARAWAESVLQEYEDDGAREDLSCSSQSRTTHTSDRVLGDRLLARCAKGLIACSGPHVSTSL